MAVRCALFALAVLQVRSVPVPQDVPPGPQAFAPDGRCRIWLGEVSRDDGRGTARLEMRFEFRRQKEFRRGDAEGDDWDLSNRHPGGVYPEVGFRVSRVLFPDGSVREAGGYVDTDSLSVTLPDLPVPEGESRIQEMDLEFTLVHVKAWRTIRVPDLGRTRSRGVNCAYVRLVTYGTDAAFTVEASGIAERDGDPDLLKEIAPVEFAKSHRWAVNNLRLVDAADEGLSFSECSVAGGASIATFTIPDVARAAGRKQAIVTEVKPIRYPVTLTLAFPTKVEEEKLSLRLADIPLPPPGGRALPFTRPSSPPRSGPEKE